MRREGTKLRAKVRGTKMLNKPRLRTAEDKHKLIMAIAVLREPYKEFRGSAFLDDQVYARMVNGRCILQRKPRRQSEKQRQMRKAFAEKYAGKRQAHAGPTAVP